MRTWKSLDSLLKNIRDGAVVGCSMAAFVAGMLYMGDKIDTYTVQTGKTEARKIENCLVVGHSFNTESELTDYKVILPDRSIVTVSTRRMPEVDLAIDSGKSVATDITGTTASYRGRWGKGKEYSQTTYALR